MIDSDKEAERSVQSLGFDWEGKLTESNGRSHSDSIAVFRGIGEERR
jgi:hypothetical protein